MPHDITNDSVLFFIRDMGFASDWQVIGHFDAAVEPRASALKATVEALLGAKLVKRETAPDGRPKVLRAKITTETVLATIRAAGTLTVDEVVNLFRPQADPRNGNVEYAVRDIIGSLHLLERIEEVRCGDSHPRTYREAVTRPRTKGAQAA